MLSAGSNNTQSTFSTVCTSELAENIAALQYRRNYAVFVRSEIIQGGGMIQGGGDDYSADNAQPMMGRTLSALSHFFPILCTHQPI